MIIIAIAILICGLMALFSLFMLAYSPKHIYKVHYVRTSPYRSEEHYIFIKARNIADIQRQLEKNTLRGIFISFLRSG